jgi:hypothetical protein
MAIGPASRATPEWHDTGWMEHAACKDRYDLDYFDIDCSLYECLRVCAICKVGDKCLDWAVGHNLTEGIWGGAWGQELLTLVRQGRGRRVGGG